MCRVDQLELQSAHAKAAAQLLDYRHLDEERRTCTCVCEGESRAATGDASELVECFDLARLRIRQSRTTHINPINQIAIQ